MALHEPPTSSECDFKIIDDHRHMPLASHLYVFEVVGAPGLMRSVVGSTSNEAASDLHAARAVASWSAPRVALRGRICRRSRRRYARFVRDLKARRLVDFSFDCEIKTTLPNKLVWAAH